MTPGPKLLQLISDFERPRFSQHLLFGGHSIYALGTAHSKKALGIARPTNHDSFFRQATEAPGRLHL